MVFYIPSLSCETQLIITIQDWASNANNKNQTDVLLLDFSKAFDKVSHHKLLHKIDFYGVRGKTKSWISGFLDYRLQRVLVNGKVSSSTDMLSGVPQGTVLGFLLFLLCINATNIQSPMRLFADDSLVYWEITFPLNMLHYRMT